MLSKKPSNLRSSDLYSYIMQYLAVNTGKVVTPSLITNTINKCLGIQFTTNKTVSNYLAAITNAGLVCELDRQYISTSCEESRALSYNRTYYFSDLNSFMKFYDYAFQGLYKHKTIDSLSFDIALAKTKFYHKSKEAGYNIKSGVLSYFSHLEGGRTKKNTLSFDFVLEDENRCVYVAFQDSKDFNEDEFTIETKFAIQNIINKLSVIIVTISPKFIQLDSDVVEYIHLNEILEDQVNI